MAEGVSGSMLNSVGFGGLNNELVGVTGAFGENAPPKNPNLMVSWHQSNDIAESGSDSSNLLTVFRGEFY